MSNTKRKPIRPEPVWESPPATLRPIPPKRMSASEQKQAMKYLYENGFQ